jgi:hypothetical protein
LFFKKSCGLHAEKDMNEELTKLNTRIKKSPSIPYFRLWNTLKSTLLKTGTKGKGATQFWKWKKLSG